MAVPFLDSIQVTVATGASGLTISNGTNSIGLYESNGTPEASVTAPKGSMCFDYTNGDIYKKSSGTGNTGWSILATGSGATNLSATPSSTTVVVASDTGTDATLVAASGTDAGLMLPAQYTKLGYITVTQAVDLDDMETDIGQHQTLLGVADGSTHMGTYTGTTITDNQTIKQNLQEVETAIEARIPKALTSGYMLVGNISNVATGVAISGDLYVSNTGVAVVISATTSTAGKVELATNTETTTGSDTARATTPAGVNAYFTALVGNASGVQHLGTFTGTTIPDNSTVKAALQALETKAESLVSGLQFVGTWDATTAAPSLGNNEFVRVSVAGTTSVTTVNQGAKTDWAVGDFLMKDNAGNLHVIDNTDAPVNLAVGTVTTTTVPVTNSLGTGFTIPAATTSLAGVISSTDKLKVDRLGGYSANYGNGSATSFTITHSLGSLDVTVNVYRVSDGVQVFPQIARTSTTVVTIDHSIAPTTNQYRVVVSRTGA